MAWNPSPKVAVAREAAQKLDRDMVVVFAFDAASGTYESITYGATPKKCDHARRIADRLFVDVGIVYADTEI